jgi:hypothetical protein
LINLPGRWTEQQICFVTRLKDNAACERIGEEARPANRGILSDQLIQFTGAKAHQDCCYPLRRVAVWDEVNNRDIVLLTNLTELQPLYHCRRLIRSAGQSNCSSRP